MLFKYPIVALLSCLTLAGCATPTGITEAVKNLFQGEARIALVIGNGDYLIKDLYLGSPVGDALDMGKALKELGFEVLPYSNANQQQMEMAFQTFREKLANTAPDRKRVGLFYYSGHGVEHQGKTYLVATDVSSLTDTPEKSKFVSLASLFKEVNELNRDSKETKSLFILDNCRDNPFDKNLLLANILTGTGENKGSMEALEGVAKGLKWADDRANESVKNDLKLLSKPDRNSLIAYATAEVDPAKDGGRGKNSPYTQILLELIKKPMPLEEILRQVADKMVIEVEKTGGQKPALYVTPGGGNIYLRLPPAPFGG